MRPLTKEQARAPKRETAPISLPEFSAPLLLAKPSAGLALHLRSKKADLGSPEGIGAVLSDMLVDEDGNRLLSTDDLPAFLDGISTDSLNALSLKCFDMLSGKGGAPGNPVPSTST